MPTNDSKQTAWFTLLLFHALHQFVKGSLRLYDINGEKGELTVGYRNYRFTITVSSVEEPT